MNDLIRRKRTRLALAAYSYEIINSPFITDSVYDALSLYVESTKEQSTGDEELDKFFREEFSPDTGMWIYKHPGYLKGTLQNTYSKLFT